MLVLVLVRLFGVVSNSFASVGLHPSLLGQVFRRRQADMDRLQPADIERSRSQLADLERRFLERVAMTNRCKTGGEIGDVSQRVVVSPSPHTFVLYACGPSGPARFHDHAIVTAAHEFQLLVVVVLWYKVVAAMTICKAAHAPTGEFLVSHPHSFGFQCFSVGHASPVPCRSISKPSPPARGPVLSSCAGSKEGGSSFDLLRPNQVI